VPRVDVTIFIVLFFRLSFWLSMLFRVLVTSLLISKVLRQLLSSKYHFSFVALFLLCGRSTLRESLVSHLGS
jgi:hypothetical protein